MLRMDHAKLLDVLTSLPIRQSILPRAVCFATSRPANHAICSFIDLSGYASGPIRRRLFIDYIIIDDILNTTNVYFDNMVGQIYLSDLQLNKANASDTEAAFLDLHLSISNGIVSTKIYDKRDDFYFEIVNFPFLDGDVPRSISYGVYISQLIRFSRASSYVINIYPRNKLLTQKLHKQSYQYHKLRKTFSFIDDNI